MNKKLLVLVIVVSAALFTAGGILAKAVPDMIKLQDPAYKEHKKGVVEFTHGKHQTEYAEKYPEFYKNGCGECHHDKDNKPLSNLKEGDDVQKCIECHKIAAEAPKGKKAKIFLYRLRNGMTPTASTSYTSKTIGSCSTICCSEAY